MTMSCRGPVLALVTALACVLLSPTASQATPSQRITNGSKVGADAFDQRWRSIVSLRGPAFPDDKGRAPTARAMHQCGGTLIRADIVVTAAHCVTDSRVLLTGATVLGGTHRLSDGRRTFGTVVKVRETVIHPRYVEDFFSSQMGYDIAVLRLARPMPGAVPMPMVAAGEAHLWGGGNGRRTARVAGWGITAPVITERMWNRERNPALEAQTQLREVQIPLKADRFCASTDSAMGNSAPEFERETMLCGGTRDGVKGLPTGRRGACMGDSGGPLVVSAADGSPRLAGIVSWGPSDAGPCNRASVFARVDALRGWVEQTVAAMDAPAAITLPSTLRGRPVSFDSLRVEWDEVVGPVERLRLVRDVSLEQLYTEQFGALGPLHPKVRRALGSTRLLLELGSTGEGARSLHARWLAPRTAGARRAYRLRLQASDANGRTVLGPAVDIRPAVDSSRPGRPRPRLYRTREGVPGISWRPVRDNHCVLYYAVQVRRAGTGAWGTHAQRDSASCHPDMDGEWFEYDGEGTSAGLYGRRPGRYAVRVVAVDKAGNRSMSELRIVRVRRMARESEWPSSCRLRGDRVVCVFPKDDF